MRVLTAVFDRQAGIRRALKPLQLDRRLTTAFSEDRPWVGSGIASRENWIADSARLEVITNEPTAERDRELMLRSDDGVLAWSGYVRGSVPSSPNALQVSRLGGCFAMVQASEEGLVGWTSVHRMEPLYLAEGRDIVVLSTSARIAYAVANSGTPSPPERAVLGLSGPGYMISNETPFAGVVAVPGDTQVLVNRRGVTISKLPAPDIDEQTPLPEVVEAVSMELLSAAESHTRRGEAALCQITGGKDSRLVLAALAHVGARATAITNGFPEHPDVQVGRRVAAVLGVPHEVQSPQVTRGSRTESIRVDPRMRAYRTLTATESMLTSYEALDPAGDSYRRDTVMGGHGGELIRGGFGYRLKRMDAPSALRRLDLIALPHAGLLTDGGRTLANELLARWRHQISDSPERALADFYLVYRAGRWRSVSHSAESIRHPNFSLLADNQVVRAAMATSQSHTWDERLAFLVLERMAPGLAAIPFFRSRWNFEYGEPSSLFAPSRWKEREPVDVTEGRGAFNWRIDYSNRVHDHFTEVLLERSRLHELIDRSLLAEFLNETSSARTGAQAKTLWSMYTAQQLLLGLLTSKSPPNPLTFEVDVPA